MPETVDNKQIFSLLEVTRSIRKTIADRYQNAYWIKAEMNKLNHYSHSGHCYPELVEKQDGKVVAQIRSNLWKEDYNQINNNFLKVLKEPLKDGIKILFQATISFDPMYGLSLRIIDIDPSFTLGDLEKEKLETIQKLKEEGIFHKNKSRPLPLIPQRIAIISVETSKGYADFLRVLENNHWNYRFFHFLFPSLLQGERAVESIISQLKRVKKVKQHFDVVAIIRGGGGDIGLSCYNHYKLAREIALFPIPVFTGIGHATNETVVEMTSHTNAITPTKLAEFLIQQFHNFSVPVQKAEVYIRDQSIRMLRDERKRFGSEIKLFRSVTRNVLEYNHNETMGLLQSLFRQTQFICRNESVYVADLRSGIRKSAVNMYNSAKRDLRLFGLNIKKDVQTHLREFNQLVFHNSRQMVRGSHVILTHDKRMISQTHEKLPGLNHTVIRNEIRGLTHIEKQVENMNPLNVLKRGYSITTIDGTVIKSAGQVKQGDVLNTLVYDGSINSTVNFKKLNINE
jgi:exodeoxyribonuclease VII large subunit